MYSISRADPAGRAPPSGASPDSLTVSLVLTRYAAIVAACAGPSRAVYASANR